MILPNSERLQKIIGINVRFSVNIRLKTDDRVVFPFAAINEDTDIQEDEPPRIENIRGGFSFANKILKNHVVT